jgi:hypothetical protein
VIDLNDFIGMNQE